MMGVYVLLGSRNFFKTSASRYQSHSKQRHPTYSQECKSSDVNIYKVYYVFLADFEEVVSFLKIRWSLGILVGLNNVTGLPIPPSAPVSLFPTPHTFPAISNNKQWSFPKQRSLTL